MISATKLLFGGYLASVPNIAALRSYPISKLQRADQIGVGGGDQLGDHNGGIYTWDPASIRPDDNALVVKPLNQAIGRWIFIGKNASDAGLRADLLDPVKGTNLITYANGVSLKTKLDQLAAGASGGGDHLDFVSQRLTGESDNTAFNRLIRSGKTRLYFKAGGGLSAGGKYNIGCEPWTNGDIQRPSSPNYNPNATVADLIEAPGNMVSGLSVRGDGKGRTVFLQGDFNYGFMGNALGGANIVNVRFEDVTFEGNNVAYTGSSQTFHNVAIFGVTDATFLRCEFKASPGDGFYAARGPKQGSPNHNYNLTIMHCEFNGVNNRNRNPFSHEDCNGIWFAYNYVHDFTANGEPGGWDTEPVITKGTIQGDIFQTGRVVFAYNRFERCNGVVFCMQMDPRLSKDVAGMFLVQGNIVEDCFSFLDVVGPPDDQPDITRTFSLLIKDNIVRRLTSNLGRIGGALGVEVKDNIFEDADAFVLGYGWGNRFFDVRRNTFRRCGRTNGFPILTNLDNRYVTISENDFIDPGRTDGLGTNAILLTRDGADELAPNPGTIKPRLAGIALNRNRIYNTRSDGSAGRLTHFAIMNSTGGYGDGASKVGNEFYGTPIPNGDTFNPPAPKTGRRATQVLNGATIGNGGTAVFDIGVSGVTPDSRFRAYFNTFVPTDPRIVIGIPTPISSTAVRVAIFNGGVGWTIPNGTLLIVEEY